MDEIKELILFVEVLFKRISNQHVFAPTLIVIL